MTLFSIQDYVESLLPNFITQVPGYNPKIVVNGVMALYWTYIFDPDPITNHLPLLDEELLTERQKYMIALRVAVTSLPVINGWFTDPQILEATALPATAKFQDLPNMIKVLLPLWQANLATMEAAEDIFFNIVPTVPAFLKSIEGNWALPGETDPAFSIPVIQAGVVFEGGE